MPITGKQFGSYQYAGQLKGLDQFAGSKNSRLQNYLYPLAYETPRLLDHFTGDTFGTDLWTTNAGTGATAFAVPATPIVGGAARAATGTDATLANRRVNLYGAPVWSGNQNCGLELRFKVDVVTSFEFFMGFLDTHTTLTTPTPIVTDIDVPSFAAGAGDLAGVAMDTSQTLTTMALVTLGSGGLNTGATDAIGTLVPTAGTWMTIRLQLYANDGSTSGNNVVCWVDNKRANYVGRVGAINGGTLVRPFVYLGGLNTTSKVVDLDYVTCWQDPN